ncbi:hypothetical protein E2C01_072254 [Portunus trituberculatus]|uniref:Uncharacterized protein n=1 Tax=Portunus trituberculatus TaxID=210409 RepID=A0A5B7I8F5_PORTR|nr:hypothetical protein [Portunus trituberculatus]
MEKAVAKQDQNVGLVHQKKSNHSFSFVTRGRHLDRYLIVYIHFLSRQQLVNAFQVLRVTLSD